VGGNTSLKTKEDKILQQLKIPVVFMRGGTSKGLFFHESDLPAESSERDKFLLSAMGSPDRYGRQLNGMGGGISSLSKIIIVRKSLHEAADIEYLHGQVAVDQPLIDYSANCGNLSSAVGPFAISEGLFQANRAEKASVRLHNLNSGFIIHAQIPLGGGEFFPDGDFDMPGVSSRGARIELEYLNDGTAPVFTTGRVVDELYTPDGREVSATLADVTMPCIFVSADSVGLSASSSPDKLDAEQSNMLLLEIVRRLAAVKMGLSATVEEAPLATPKIGIVGKPADYVALDGTVVKGTDYDILLRMISMGKAHKAAPLAAAMCLTAATLSRGSIPNLLTYDLAGPAVRIGTPSGILTVGAVLNGKGSSAKLDRTIVYSSARRLMEGRVVANI
jgi:2-methylaconitate cis-trans-isomerase PrpF